MAALIAGTGKRGSSNGSFGLAPGAKILPLRVGAKNFEDDAIATARALHYAADSDAKIINISLGAPEENAQEREGINYALSKGKMVFAAVGNSGNKLNAVEYPAAYPGVIGVAAVDKDSKAAPFSQHGPQVDLAAPGVEMVSACPGGSGLCTGDGTSGATALASASAALVWSVHPDWTANQVTRVLINTAGAPQSGAKRTDSIGYGVVRPRIALENPGDPGPADVNPLPGPSGAADGKSTGGKAVGQPSAAAESSDSGGTNTTWIAIGAGTAVVLGAAAAVAFTISRRKSHTR